MGRYVYKPLLTYFDGDPEEKKYEFLQKYKESLRTGELLVDLYNYDIYVSSNGLEYPIPTTSEIKEEIINWIESDEGPLSQYKKNKISNDDTSPEHSLEKKKEHLQSLLKNIERYKELFKGQIDEDENKLLRMERECEEFYSNLAVFTKSFNTTDSASNDLNLVFWKIISKYIELIQRYIDVKNRIEDKKSRIQSLNKSLKSRLIDNYIKVINQSVALNGKLDQTDIAKESNYTAKINITFDKEITENPSFLNILTEEDKNHIKFNKADTNKAVITISSEGGTTNE